MLGHILGSFPGAYYAENALGLVALIRSSAEAAGAQKDSKEDKDKDKKRRGSKSKRRSSKDGSKGGAGGGEDEARAAQARLFTVLAGGLRRAPPPADQRLPLLNDAWRVVTKLGPARLLLHPTHT